MENRYKLFLIDDQHVINFVHKKIIKLVVPEVEIMDFVDPIFALETIKNTRPNLIFLDLNMPHMNGWQLLDHMTEQQIMVPVIIITSSGSHADRTKAEDYPQVMGYEQKPLHRTGFENLFHRLASNKIYSTPQL